MDGKNRFKDIHTISDINKLYSIGFGTPFRLKKFKKKI